MTQDSVIQRNPLLRWLIQPKRIPLLFSVTIIAGIFYHYAPKLTPLWILLSLVMQAGLFRLFDFVKKHPFIGGAAYVVTGIAFVIAAQYFINLGYSTPFWAPQETNLQLNFMVWFLTPQSVLVTQYLGYTVGLFLLFTMFIATTAYYFTLVRYRVLMSFVVMIFPFAIYAKEAEDMPVPSIIILLVCYFAVMIYCKQAHGEDSDVVQRYEPDTESTLSAPPKKSAHANVKPELLDGAFLNATGVFMAAATILILVIPKPTVTADRALLDTVLDFSAFSDILMDAISGFTDSSDGGTYSGLDIVRTLFYTQAREPLNLRIRTFTNYDYDKDEWNASAYDQMPDLRSESFTQQDGFLTLAETADPAEIVTAFKTVAVNHPDFAERWNLQEFAALPDEDYSALYFPLSVNAPRINTVYPAPLHMHSFDALSIMKDPMNGYVCRNSVLMTPQQFIVYNETYYLTYLSETFSKRPAAYTLMRAANGAQWEDMIMDAWSILNDDEAELKKVFLDAYNANLNAKYYADSVVSETPESVRELAFQLTEGLESDYDKATAICDYLRISGDFTYSLEFPITQKDNVETFLFENKTGVCYQFASAMAEMCRAVGLPVRYVEGYSMSEPDNRPFSEADFAITTDDAHAFVDVFIAGYGWMMMDATAASTEEKSKQGGSILSTLQFSGFILFGGAVIFLLTALWIVPVLSEKHFRRKYQKQRDAAVVQAAFARLRKQWQAEPAVTARTLCAEKSAFLQVDLSDLLEGFEQTVYGGRCTPETADRVFRTYCAAYDAWKPACKRQRKEQRIHQRAERKARKETI